MSLQVTRYINFDDEGVEEYIFKSADVTNILIRTGDMSNAKLEITLVNKPLADLDDVYTPELIFNDDNGSGYPTITRNRGSWNCEHFAAGQTITIVGTVSNDGSYTIESVTDTVLTLINTDTLVDETTALNSGVTIHGEIPNSEWHEYYVVPINDSYYQVFEFGPTAFKITRLPGYTANVEVWVRS